MQLSGVLRDLPMVIGITVELATAMEPQEALLAWMGLSKTSI